MQLSVAVGALPLYPVTTTLAYARDAGADGVELLLTPGMLRRGPRTYARIAEERAIPVLSVHGLMRWRRRSFERKMMDDLASIAFAAALPTCRLVVLHPPLTGPRPSPLLNHWLQAICEARERAAKPDLALTLENRGENHDGTSAQLLDDFDRLRHVVGEWGLAVTLDIAHAASHGVVVSDALSAVLPRLANVHLSDVAPRSYSGGIRNGLLRDHQLPGHGQLPLDDTISVLARAGYAGPLTLELSPSSLHAYWPWKAKTLLRMAVQDMRARMAATGAVAQAREQPRYRAV